MNDSSGEENQQKEKSPPRLKKAFTLASSQSSFNFQSGSIIKLIDPEKLYRVDTKPTSAVFAKAEVAEVGVKVLKKGF